MDVEQARKLLTIVEKTNERFSWIGMVLKRSGYDGAIDMGVLGAQAGLAGRMNLLPQMRMPDVTERERSAYWLGRAQQAALDAKGLLEGIGPLPSETCDFLKPEAPFWPKAEGWCGVCGRPGHDGGDPQCPGPEKFETDLTPIDLGQVWQRKSDAAIFEVVARDLRSVDLGQLGALRSCINVPIGNFRYFTRLPFRRETQEA